ncbi:MAG TPA: GtrA family protein, partial [Bacteroidia bacterium]|nr:GtrA family protein [Bacteroidia bacterium]
IMFNYVLKKQPVPMPGFEFQAPTVALMVSYSCGLITNFSITKFFVFHESTLRTRWQFLRFASVAFFVLGLNYLAMTFLIRQLNWYPTIARTCSALSIGVLSFIMHYWFSFKVKKTDNSSEEIDLLDIPDEDPTI